MYLPEPRQASEVAWKIKDHLKLLPTQQSVPEGGIGIEIFINVMDKSQLQILTLVGLQPYFQQGSLDSTAGDYGSSWLIDLSDPRDFILSLGRFP